MTVDQNTSNVIKYQGRKVIRAGSELRRKRILEAALRIGIREGVRGIRHRAVAKEAEVPLSATTYYFKDINDLINDAFTLFVEQAMHDLSQFWIDSSEKLEQYHGAFGSSPASRHDFVENMSDLAVQYIDSQLARQRNRVLAAQALQQEALRSEVLRDIVMAYRQGLVSDLTAFYARMGSKEPELDAQLSGSVFQDIEYQCLLHGDDYQNKVPVKALLYRHIKLSLSGNE